MKRWHYSNWIWLEQRLRSSIVVFLSLLDDEPRLGRAFCAPKSAYTDPPKSEQKHGTPLPPLDELMEAGKVLGRIARINAASANTWRDLLFVCDECHTFARKGETDPSEDERTFALSRQPRLIPIVATESISSLPIGSSR